ncbi:MAG: T9SS type A sorting domain-containing protein [Bacteroidetes bacterium]|nr:T9SS type A sorting domain-containing protein [Bacteroidota bacterium]
MKTKTFLRLGLLLCCMFAVAGVQAQRTVTMRLNMASVPDTTNAMGLIEVRGAGGEDGSVAPYTLVDGNVIDWSDASTLEPVNEKGPNGEDSDYWSLSFMINESDSLVHKFYSDQLQNSLSAGWEADPNPAIAPGTGDVDLGLHFFEAQVPWHGVDGRRGDYNWLPWEPKMDSVAVWYRVAMFGQLSEDKGYDPMMAAPDQIIGVRGAPIVNANDTTMVGPLDWGAAQVMLNRESMDESAAGYNIYSGVAYYPASLAGMQQEYKFVLEHGNNVGWEDGPAIPSNRSFTVPASDTTLHWAYYGNTAPSKVEPVSGQVVFGVDMSAFETIGIFDTARRDTLWVFGDFNGWQGCRDEQRLEECYMFKEPGGTNFAAAVPLTRPAGWTSGYKYFLDFNDTEFQAQFGVAPPSGWEEGHRTGINRQFDFAGDPNAAQILSLSYFNDATPMNVMMDGEETEVMFSVTMQQAIDSQAQPFDPAVDSVSIHLGDPIWAYTQGEDGTDHDIPLWDEVLLTDPDGDGTYTGTYMVSGPSYNILTYRYMYGGKSMSAQEMGSDTRVPGRNRVHFIPKNADGTFQAVYELPVHEFNLMAGPLPYDENPYITNTGIEQSEEVPTNIWLGENYPNPFNPTTTIEYGLEQQSHVKLHIYDMLGRRVATLVDGLQQAATYTVNFDASRLASGIYLYRLETPHHSFTKRMMLIK